MRGKFAWLVVLLLTGCGGLSPEFAGTWTGSMVVTFQTSGGPVTSSNNVDPVVIQNNGGEVDWMVCADKSAKLRLDGAGTHGTWSGIQSCPLVTADCPTGSAVFRDATADLAPGPILKGVAHGTAALCQYTYAVTWEFNGTK